MIEPQEFTIDYEGKTYTYNVSKFPATVGREIISQYPIGFIPKIGSYQLSEDMMIKMMAYVERVKDDGTTIALANKALIDNHVPNWEVLARLEIKMIEYNCSFFRNGKGLDSLTRLVSLAEPKITEILTALSGKLSHPEKQPFMNSKQSIL